MGHAEWIGTTDRLADSLGTDDFTIVRFTHQGWAEPVEFLAALQHEVGGVPPQPQGADRDRNRVAVTPTTSRSATGTELSGRHAGAGGAAPACPRGRPLGGPGARSESARSPTTRLMPKLTIEP